MSAQGRWHEKENKEGHLRSNIDLAWKIKEMKNESEWHPRRNVGWQVKEENRLL